MTINCISKIGSVGYRFRPTDQELVGVYMNQKISGRDSLSNIISLPEVNNLYHLEPWDLPNQLWSLEIDGRDQTWYFFYRQKPNLKQQKRATKAGFWSITGTRKGIKDKKTKKEIGFKRTMTYYYKDPLLYKKKKENKTAWVMHEYHYTANLSNQNTILLYKLKYKEYTDIFNREVQLNSHLHLPNNEDICPQDEIEQWSSPHVDNLNNNNSKTNQQNLIVDKNHMIIPNETEQNETSNISNKTNTIEGGSPEDGMPCDELLALLASFDQTENGQLSSLDCNELDIHQTSNQQNMVVHDRRSNLLVMNTLSPDLSGSDFGVNTDETAGCSSNEIQPGPNVNLPSDVQNHAMEDGSPEIQDWMECNELQDELASLVHGLWGLTDCDKTEFERSNQLNINAENESFNSAFIGMVSPDEPLKKRPHLDNFIMINI